MLIWRFGVDVLMLGSGDDAWFYGCIAVYFEPCSFLAVPVVLDLLWAVIQLLLPFPSGKNPGGPEKILYWFNMGKWAGEGIVARWRSTGSEGGGERGMLLWEERWEWEDCDGQL